MAANTQGTSVPFSFNGLSLAAIPHEDDLWLTGIDVGRALEYADPSDAIKKLYKRNAEELDRYSTVIKLPVRDGDGGTNDGTWGDKLSPQVGVEGTETGPEGTVQLRPVRVFSEEGVMILTMLSSQPKAAAFRAWAVSVLKAYRHGNLVIANPASRERLLETCIKEVRFSNPAAIHTLIHHFGYPESIGKPVAALPSRHAPLRRPALVEWVIDRFLPQLAQDIAAGKGPMLTAVRTRKPRNARLWKEVKETGAVFALEHRAGDFCAFIKTLAEEEGIEYEGSAQVFSRWLAESEPDMTTIGWTRRHEKISERQQVYRLIFWEGGDHG